MSEDIIEINIEKLLKIGLSLESYFVLDCIYRNRQLLLEEYVTTFGQIDKPVFINLIEMGYIKPIVSEITFDVLKVTQKFLNDFGYSKLDHKRYFKELKDTYPTKAINGRRLHQDLANCEKKYKNIVDSEQTHKNILKCVQLYIEDLKRTGSSQYIQLLSTWINQKNYEQYLEEAINNENIGKQDALYDAV